MQSIISPLCCIELKVLDIASTVFALNVHFVLSQFIDVMQRLCCNRVDVDGGHNPEEELLYGHSLLLPPLKMKLFMLMCIVFACAMVSTQAFTIKANNARTASIRVNKIFKPQSYTVVSTPSSSSSLFMSDGENANMVPVDKQNVENAAAVTGGILGFVLAGPVAGLVLAAVSNYVVKKDNDSGEALR